MDSCVLTSLAGLPSKLSQTCHAHLAAWPHDRLRCRACATFMCLPLRRLEGGSSSVAPTMCPLSTAFGSASAASAAAACGHLSLQSLYSPLSVGLHLLGFLGIATRSLPLCHVGHVQPCHFISPGAQACSQSQCSFCSLKLSVAFRCQAFIYARVANAEVVRKAGPDPGTLA